MVVIAILIFLIILISIILFVKKDSEKIQSNYMENITNRIIDDQVIISRNNRETINNVRRQLRHNLRNRRNNVVMLNNNNINYQLRNNDIIEVRNNVQPMLNNQQYIDNALEFAINGIVGLMIDEGWTPDFELANMVIDRQNEIINDRQNIANQEATHQEATNKFIDLSIQHTSDTQNVHDTGVLNGLKETVDRLKQEQSTSQLPSMQNVVKDLTNRFYNTDGFDTISRVLEAVNREEIVMSLGISDKECLQRIWLRINHDKNKEMKERLINSLFDNLIDCVENDYVVCVNGRASRIISTLVLYDFDKKNWDIRKFEDIKNEIFENTKRIIASVAIQATNSQDIEMQKAGRIYLAKTQKEYEEIGEIKDEYFNKLIEEMKREIGLMVDNIINDYYKGNISPIVVDKIKKEAQSAAL